MNFSRLLAVAAAATLLVPGTALAGKGNGKPTGKPGAPPAAQVGIRTLEGPKSSPETAPVPTTEAPGVVPAPAAPPKKAKGKSRKSAKAACKGLSKKHRKGTKGTPYSRCIVAVNRQRKQPVESVPVALTPDEPVAPIDPVIPPAPVEEPTEPVVTTGPVGAPIA